MRAYDRECTETFWDGHVRAFAFLGGVRRRITHDNSRAMVAKIIGPRQRELTRGFLRLESLYLFDQHSGRVERPNEKGLVEGTVKFARLNFLVPIAQVRDLDELNAYLLGCCGEDPDRRLRGHSATRRVLPEEERDALLPPPAGPFDACRKESTTAGAQSLVRFDDNGYSVPVRCANHPVVVRACCPHEDWRATTFSLDGRQHLRHVVAASTDVTAYRAWPAPGGAS